MSQFDVYVNPSGATRKAFPYLVDIQSPVISEIATRLVVPLVRSDSFVKERLVGLTPEVEHQGEKYLLLIPQLASVPARILQNPIGSLSQMRDEIIAALDFAVTGI